MRALGARLEGSPKGGAAVESSPARACARGTCGSQGGDPFQGEETTHAIHDHPPRCSGARAGRCVRRHGWGPRRHGFVPQAAALLPVARRLAVPGRPAGRRGPQRRDRPGLRGRPVPDGAVELPAPAPREDGVPGRVHGDHDARGDLLVCPGLTARPGGPLPPPSPEEHRVRHARHRGEQRRRVPARRTGRPAVHLGRAGRRPGRRAGDRRRPERRPGVARNEPDGGDAVLRPVPGLLP